MWGEGEVCGEYEVCVGSGRCVEQEGGMGDVLKDGVCAVRRSGWCHIRTRIVMEILRE